MAREATGKLSTTTARAPPSERKALGWLKSRSTYMRHPPFVAVSPVRRHVLDPRRRKSSIISRPLEAGFSCSRWTIFSMSTLMPPWRSTVSQSAPAMACRRIAALGVAAPGFRVVEDWRARRVRSRCCLSHSPVRPSQTLGRLRFSVDEPHSLNMLPLCQTFLEGRTPVWLPSRQSVF